MDATEKKAGRRGGPAVKLAWVALVLVAMLLPHWMIGGVIEEREERHEAVRREIGAAWGGPQVLLAPVMAVPWAGAEGRRGMLYIQPERLDARVELAPQTRRRGLYEVPIYTATARLEGRFRPSLTAVPQEPAAVLAWEEAIILAGSHATRLVGDAPPLAWGGRDLSPVEGLTGGDCLPARALAWRPHLVVSPGPEEALPFALTLALRGSQRFVLQGGPQSGTLAIAAPWPTPSFVGDELPERSLVEGEGFSAEWNLAAQGGPARRSLCGLVQAGVGVQLLEAVPTYRMVSRASKYAMLFLALAFATYVLFELLAGLRIHIVQYGLLGCSVVMFPLLLLAIGEPLGFVVAYAASTLAVMAQASLYTAAVTGRRLLAAIFAGVLAALFGFLYVVLSLEALSLLVGTLALFLVLSVVMAVTRKVEWGQQGG